MKKLLKAMFIGLLSLGLLVGCGNDEAQESNDAAEQEVVEESDEEVLESYAESMGVELTNIVPFEEADIKGIVGEGTDAHGEEGFIAVARKEETEPYIGQAFEDSESAIEDAVDKLQ